MSVCVCVCVRVLYLLSPETSVLWSHTHKHTPTERGRETDNSYINPATNGLVNVDSTIKLGVSSVPRPSQTCTYVPRPSQTSAPDRQPPPHTHTHTHTRLLSTVDFVETSLRVATRVQKTEGETLPIVNFQMMYQSLH